MAGYMKVHIGDSAVVVEVPDKPACAVFIVELIRRQMKDAKL